MQAAPNRVSEYRRRAAENRAKARETTDKQASKELLADATIWTGWQSGKRRTVRRQPRARRIQTETLPLRLARCKRLQEPIDESFCHALIGP